MQEYLKRLNKGQYEAATTIDGRVLILAGAGSGKTATLVARVAYMLDMGIPADSILLLTFTNKAAKEMQDRVEGMIGPAARDVTACTFHSFCANFMRKNAYLISLDSSFNIIDSPDASDVMSIARQDFVDEQKKAGTVYALKDFPSTKQLLMVHENAINNCVLIDSAIEWFGMQAYRNEIKEIDNIFMKYKHDRNLVDYNDLLLYTERILSENESVRARLDERFRYISCDEYQDTNTIQNRILNLLSRDYANLSVVGDDNQSIYGWRSADIRNILDFDKKYTDCKTIILDENYRSSQEILDFANAAMTHATEGKEKWLHGQFNNIKPELVISDSNYEEEKFILDKISKLHREGMPFKSMAVMVRSSMQSFGLEMQLTKLGIPFEKFGGIKFMEKTAVKDTLSFLRVVVNEKDEIAWFRLLQLYPGIGKGFAKKISASIAKEGIDVLPTLYPKRKFAEYLVELNNTIKYIKDLELADQLDHILETYYPRVTYRSIEAMDISDISKADAHNNMDKQIEEAKALYDMASKYKTAQKFLADIVLESATGKTNDGDYLNITTVHSAKGLEYDVVFLMDVIDGIMPKCQEGDDEDPEELRVFYVAVTRAKRQLYLMAVKYTSLCGIGGGCILSHFINKDDVLERLKISDKSELNKVRYKYNFNLY